MSQPREPLQRVAIVGAGQVGVIASIAIKRALPQCEVTIVAHIPAPADFADRAASALPFTNRFHDRLGIDEALIVARAGGSHRLVQRYFGWGGQGQHGAVPYGSAGPDGAAAFGQAWGGGSRSAQAQLQPQSLAEVLANAGRFRAPQGDEPSPLAKVDYALRWHQPAYLGVLIEQARRLGVAYRDATVVAVECAGQDIISLRLEAGETLEADLYLDCSGTARVLATAQGDADFVRFNEEGGAQSVLIARPGEPMLALEDRTTLTVHGWLREIAGRDGLQQIARPVSAISSEAFGLGGAEEISFEPGALSHPWRGNSVAIGDSAAAFEPLGDYNLDLAHRMLALLLELLPGRTVEGAERREFNRRAGLMVDGVRDTLALHYSAPAASAVFGTSEIPDAAARAVDQFMRRGRLPHVEEQPLSGSERQSLLRALGFHAATPPQHRVASQAQSDKAARVFASEAKALLAAVPPYGEWMRRQLAPR